MTYLQLVNNVLRRMREDTVTTVNQSTYSQMVGDFVNDAKRMVEDSWDWSGLRTTLTISTSDDIFNYVLTGSGNRVEMLTFLNDTSNWFMEYRTPAWFDNVYLNQDPVKGSPRYYVYNGVDSAGDTQIDLYPKPDGVYTLRFNCILRTADLEDDADDVTIPSAPIIHLAIALLARERGETGGTSAPEYFGIADRMLSDAIALDGFKHPEELIWTYT